MPEYDPNAPNARRYPRVITDDDIAEMPRLKFNTGITTAIFLSREADDARYFRQGICYCEPGHKPYSWDQLDFDETHYVLWGKIHLRIRDSNKREIVYEAKEREHIYLPGGYYYTLETTGIDSAFFWSSGPSPRNGLVDIPDFSATLKAMRK